MRKFYQGVGREDLKILGNKIKVKIFNPRFKLNLDYLKKIIKIKCPNPFSIFFML
jgi:hypothetical protein